MNNSKLKKLIKYAGAPLLVILVYGSLAILYRTFDLPSQEEVLSLVRSYYKDYGYWLIFVSALIEGMLLVNWYFPGSIVIVLGVSLAYPDPLKAAALVGLVTIGFFVSAVINYALGRYGWYRLMLKFGLKGTLDGAKNKLEQKGLTIVFSSYIHPNLGALTATSAGILHLSFTRFALYSIVALICWNTMWGLLAYVFGEVMLNYLSYFIGAVLMIWVSHSMIKFYRQKV
jgi:membrane protein DedA with SNARE-associated domain